MSLKTDLAAEVRKAHANGQGWDDVANALGISKQYATQLATTLRKELRTAGVSDESINEILPRFRRAAADAGSAADLVAAFAAEQAAQAVEDQPEVESEQAEVQTAGE